MKLNDLVADSNSITEALKKKYNTTVVSKITLNDEDVSELVLSFALKTTELPKPVEEAKVPEVVTSAPEVVTEAPEAKVVNENQG